MFIRASNVLWFDSGNNSLKQIAEHSDSHYTIVNNVISAKGAKYRFKTCICPFNLDLLERYNPTFGLPESVTLSL